MAINWKQGLGKLSETVKSTAQTVKQTDLKDAAAKAAGSVKSTAANMKSGIENFNPEDAKAKAGSAVKNGGAALKRHFANSRETGRLAKEVLDAQGQDNDCLTVEDALTIVLLLMHADRDVSQMEEVCFADIVSDMDAEGNTDTQALQARCNALVSSAEEDEYLESLKDAITDAVVHSQSVGGGTVNKRLLLWNLLTIAYSDGSYSEEEKQILRLLTRRFNIPKDVVQEMEQAIGATLAIQAEEQALMASSRPYGVVQPRVVELATRKEAIMQGVYALLAD